VLLSKTKDVLTLATALATMANTFTYLGSHTCVSLVQRHPP
jgi:hypothetical protein